VYHDAAELCQTHSGTEGIMRSNRIRWVLWLLAGVLFAGIAPATTDAATEPDQSLRGTIPAGYKVIQLEPSGTRVSLLALIECPQIKGARHVSQGLNSRIVLPDGSKLQRFPRNFSFRVTASLRRTVLDPPSSSVAFPSDPENLLLNLKFKLRDYDALVSKEIDPASVRMIGVPADVPYDERVFRVNFDIGNRPVTDRLVLEVYSPDGNEIGKFAFLLL
jgi:hypothetical protein